MPCENFQGEGAVESRLIADVTVDCESTSHKWHIGLAALATVGFVFGVPLTFVFVLFRERQRRVKMAADGKLCNLSDSAKSSPLVFLTGSYRPECWFVEPLVCLVRVVYKIFNVIVFVGHVRQPRVGGRAMRRRPAAGRRAAAAAGWRIQHGDNAYSNQLPTRTSSISVSVEFRVSFLIDRSPGSLYSCMYLGHVFGVFEIGPGKAVFSYISTHISYIS